MPLTEELRKLLVCPVDKAELEMKPDESGMKCVQCKRVYAIRDGVPNFLIELATIED